MEIKLERLGPDFRRKLDPACASCGYDAELILRLDKMDRMFCERCLVDALLDAMNFQGIVPDSLE